MPSLHLLSQEQKSLQTTTLLTLPWRPHPLWRPHVSASSQSCFQSTWLLSWNQHDCVVLLTTSWHFQMCLIWSRRILTLHRGPHGNTHLLLRDISLGLLYPIFVPLCFSPQSEIDKGLECWVILLLFKYKFCCFTWNFHLLIILLFWRKHASLLLFSHDWNHDLMMQEIKVFERYNI